MLQRLLHFSQTPPTAPYSAIENLRDSFQSIVVSSAHVLRSHRSSRQHAFVILVASTPYGSCGFPPGGPPRRSCSPSDISASSCHTSGSQRLRCFWLSVSWLLRQHQCTVPQRYLRYHWRSHGFSDSTFVGCRLHPSTGRRCLLADLHSVLRSRWIQVRRYRWR